MRENKNLGKRKKRGSHEKQGSESSLFSQSSGDNHQIKRQKSGDSNILYGQTSQLDSEAFGSDSHSHSPTPQSQPLDFPEQSDRVTIPRDSLRQLQTQVTKLNDELKKTMAAMQEKLTAVETQVQKLLAPSSENPLTLGQEQKESLRRNKSMESLRLSLTNPGENSQGLFNNGSESDASATLVDVPTQKSQTNK